jgi:hypothetical protein
VVFDKLLFADIIIPILLSVVTPGAITSAFSRCGAWPLDLDLESKLRDRGVLIEPPSPLERFNRLAQREGCNAERLLRLVGEIGIDLPRNFRQSTESKLAAILAVPAPPAPANRKKADPGKASGQLLNHPTLIDIGRRRAEQVLIEEREKEDKRKKRKATKVWCA